MGVRACFVHFNRAILAVINIFVVLLGLATFILGVWSKATNSAYVDIVSNSSFDIPIILIIFGIVVVVVGIVGFIASVCAHHIVSKIILFIYAAFLILVVIVEIGGAIAAFVQQTEINEGFKSAARNNFDGITPDNSQFHAWDNVQSQLSCCGVTNYTDWFDANWNRTCNSTTDCVPRSCCTATAVSEGRCDIMSPDPAMTYFTTGCAEEIVSIVNAYIGAVAGVAIFIALMLIAVIIITCIVTFCKAESNSYSRFDEPEK